MPSDLTGRSTISQALTVVIEQPKRRAKLKLIELVRETDSIASAWSHRDRPSMFCLGATPGEGVRRLDIFRLQNPLASLGSTVRSSPVSRKSSNSLCRET
jgi:hypothetical protein